MNLTFIGGTGRSGTSITRKLLGCSGDVATLEFEHRLLIDPDGPIEFLKKLESYQDPYKTDLAIHRMFDHLTSLDSSSPLVTLVDYTIKNSAFLRKRFNLSKYSGWRLSDTFENYSEAVETFKARLSLSTYNARWAGSPSFVYKNQMHYFSKNKRESFVSALREFYETLVSNLLAANSKSHFVEDSTWNICHIDGLSEVFPEARFVHIYRDPRDVISSFVQQSWMPSDVRQVVTIYGDLITDILDKASANKNCYSLKFENLVQNKNTELTSLCAFLGLEYSEEMKRFPLKNANIGRYLEDFDSATIKYLNQSLASQLERLGYDS